MTFGAILECVALPARPLAGNLLAGGAVMVLKGTLTGRAAAEI